MILIADSGSTKTDWGVVSTQGINPFHQSEEVIRRILREELLPYVQPVEVEQVFFYGSGVRPEMKVVMEGILREFFPQASSVEAHSDMLGAARALCGSREGVACILGTGANSCLYDGSGIVANAPALGYILGDEGSGAVMGKRFLHDLYMGVLSEDLKMLFETETGLRLPQLIDRVYRQPLANRFLASLSEFIHCHLDEPGLRQLVVRNFVDFFRLHVSSYQRVDLPVSFVGSIAYYYQEELREAASSDGFRLGRVLKSPMDGLVSYHQEISSKPQKKAD